MRYAFVFVSIIAVWLGLLIIVAAGQVSTTAVFVFATLLTLCLYFIGFRRGKR